MSATAQPAEERLLRWFRFAGLSTMATAPLVLDYADLADRLVARLKPGPERTVALRKLLESRDAALRQAMEDTVP